MNGAAQVVFQARWDPSSLLPTVELSGSGGDILKISGAGFDPLQPYVKSDTLNLEPSVPIPSIYTLNPKP